MATIGSFACPGYPAAFTSFDELMEALRSRHIRQVLD